MINLLDQAAEAVSMFCRLNMHSKKDLPVRSSEMGLLILVHKSDQPVTPVFAAEFFKVKKPMITAMVASLEKLGYIEKKPSSKDKRSFSLCLTAQGGDLVDKTYSEYTKTMDLLKDKLGDKDFGDLVNLLKRANAVLLEEKNNG